VLDFEHLQGLYHGDQDFGELFEAYLKHPEGDFLIQGGYLFKRSRLCVLKCETKEPILMEIPEVSLAGHFGEDKTYIMVKEHYYWSHMLKDIQDINRRCSTCHFIPCHKSNDASHEPF